MKIPCDIHIVTLSPARQICDARGAAECTDEGYRLHCRIDGDRMEIAFCETEATLTRHGDCGYTLTLCPARRGELRMREGGIDVTTHFLRVLETDDGVKFTAKYSLGGAPVAMQITAKYTENDE